jgi:cystathionine beta-lyase
MIYDFDTVIDRKGSGAIKTDALQELYGRSDLIPLWIADMDFKCGDFILDALKKHCDQGIFGYTKALDNYFQSIQNWVKEEHHWTIEEEWFSYIPGIVRGIAFCISHFTDPQDKIIIQTPVYHPFHLVPLSQSRQLVFNPLIEENGNYRMNLEGLKETISKEKCKMLILCNPHNPIGITWDKKTLIELAEICYDNDILVVSDEIHSDLAVFGNKHIPFASVSEKAKENSVTFMAPSKTFNIAGIFSSFSIIPNKKIRTPFYEYLSSRELGEGNVFSYIATEAAYTYGKEWKNQMLKYIEANILFVDDFLKKQIPPIKAVIPQASFLIWLDCRELGLNQNELNSLFVNKANLALTNGEIFGKEGIGFMRMNIGSPRSIIEKALDNLKEALR